MHGLLDFAHATSFDPAAVLRELQWPVDLLDTFLPDLSIPEFCRKMNHRRAEGDPVTSLTPLTRAGVASPTSTPATEVAGEEEHKGEGEDA